jgi:hypothetical protein
MSKKGKRHDTTCDVPADNMSKLSAAQGDVIDSRLSEEDVPTSKEIVSNPLRSVNNTSINRAQYINRNVMLPKRICANKFSNEKRAYPALDVANPMETKRGENYFNSKIITNI